MSVKIRLSSVDLYTCDNGNWDFRWMIEFLFIVARKIGCFCCWNVTGVYQGWNVFIIVTETCHVQLL
jgi:hypothetical protein